MSEIGHDLPSELVRLFSERDRFPQLLRLEIHSASAERVHGSLDADERHHQALGLVHGGVYAAIVETLASWGANLNSYKDGCISVGTSNRTDFIRAHRVGLLNGLAELVHSDERDQVWEARVTRELDGKLVARGDVRLSKVPVEQMREIFPREIRNIFDSRPDRGSNAS